jgi:hypothetical protein
MGRWWLNGQTSRIGNSGPGLALQHFSYLVKRDKQIDRSHLLPIHFFGNRLNDCRLNKPEARRGFISRLQRSSGAKKVRRKQKSETKD